MNLTDFKNKFVRIRFLIISFLIIIILATVIIIQQIHVPKTPTLQITTTSPSLKEQPIIDGRFDKNAPIAQHSQKSIQTLSAYLPYRNTIQTTTGQKVTFTIFINPLDQYTLYIGILGINFRSSYDDPELPKNIQDFRETANAILSWMKNYNVNPGDIFISWGDNAYIQDNAEAWLTPSAKFPNIIKEGSNFVFENVPTK